MGITDGTKSGSGNNPLTSFKSTAAAAGANGCHETAIPQMVITSVEGESEELNLENDLNPCVTVSQTTGEEVEGLEEQCSSAPFSSEETGESSVQTETNFQDNHPVDGKELVTQRPLCISSEETGESSVQNEAHFQDNHPVNAKEHVTQRPLLINGSDASQAETVASSPEPQEPVKPVQTTVQRPLIIDAETAKKHDSAILPAESIYEVIEPTTSTLESDRIESENEKFAEKDPQMSPTKESEGFFAKSKSFWKQDGKPLFTFPKFHFSGKESKESSKVTKKEQIKKQEFVKESTEKLSSVEAVEHSKKDEAYETKHDHTVVPQGIEPKKDESSIKHETSEIKNKSKAIEDDFNLQEEPVANQPQGKKRANTPESLYETCCIRFAVLLRNKAFEMAVASSKVIPPQKPPKPTAEALAKARSEIATKRLREYQNRPHNFGDDILVGIDGIRYADEDTESSTDYKDVDNFGVILNPECYGIIRKLKSENETDGFRAPSTCSGLTSYYTADTVTLKDENSSDNTLETVSLGSYESVVCRASVPDNKIDHKNTPLSIHDQKSESCPCTMKKVKKVPPPIPPKPSILLKSIKQTATDVTNTSSKSEDATRCINSLSLSPRPVLRKTSSLEGIKKRPLTIAGVKATEFEQYSRNKPFETSVKKPILNTVVKNSTLQAVRNLPLEPPKSPALIPKSCTSEASAPKVLTKPLPPPRPPPPVKSSAVLEATKSLSRLHQPTPPLGGGIVAPPRKAVLQHQASLPRSSSPLAKQVVVSPVKPAVPPPRPPPPFVMPRSSSKPITVVEIGSASLPDTHQENKEAIDISEPIKPLPDAETFPNLEEKVLNDTQVGQDTSDAQETFAHPSENKVDVSCSESKKEYPHSKMEWKVTSDVINSDEQKQECISPPARHLKYPRPPPRVRRKRSRTVEIVSVTNKVQENRRRSQSLSDIEEKITLLSPEDPVKALYTTVNKDTAKTKGNLSSENDERLSSSTEAISGRPLPAPPPPPRSKSHSSSRRSKSDERPSLSSKLAQSECSITKSESMPDEINKKQELRPPARKKKSSKQQFFSLRTQHPKHSNNQLTKFHSLKAVNEYNSLPPPPPVKPERRIKVHPPVQFDENANVANPSSILLGPNHSDFLTQKSEPLTEVQVRPRVKSFGFENIPSERKENPPLLQRSKSESKKKSHSSWYDEETGVPVEHRVEDKNDDWEHLDWSADMDANNQMSASQMKTPPRAKKPRKISIFYVEVDENADNSKTSCTLREDKETSPLPLDCSEKSVQTSLETLSVGAASRGEMSDDTDDLLDLAQTLQDELKTIIKRHKSGEVFKSSDESCSASEPSQSSPHKSSIKKKPASFSSKHRAPLESSASSTSEIWQISSSEESEDECTTQEAANLSELSRTKKKRKIYYIAQEIMSSEEAFVDALRLLNVDFRAYVEKLNNQKGAAIIPDEVLNQILNHLPQLQHLNENLLMELKYRIEKWESVNKIADVIVKMGPFLKLYSWYIQDFESTTSVLEEAKRKYPCFGQAVKEYEMSPRCKRLTLNHYMLKPVQRIPQYRLLLQEYLHHLPCGSEDYDDTVEALRIVSEVANHANESMKHGDNFQKLISIQSSIIGHKEIIKPGRMFIKEGELMKLSRKGMQPRWFVLMNDLLLYLTPVQQGLYRVNHELTLAGMKVAIPLQQDYQNEFSIISVTRSFTLSAKSHEERQEWIVALTKAIEENASKRSTFTAGRLQQKSDISKEEMLEQGFILGKTAPVWIPDARVTMCQLCTSEFTVTFRRHHCRACGKVVCSICSSNRISLQYLGNRIARVCDECYTKLGQVSSGCTESGETDSDNQQIAVKAHLRTDRHKKPKRQLPSVLKEVCANDVGSTISGYVYKRINSSWKKCWFVVKDKVLYEFRASEDVAALRSIPLLGYQINTFTEPFEGIDASLLFEIVHPGQTPILFHAETPGSSERWIKVLKEATVLE